MSNHYLLILNIATPKETEDHYHQIDPKAQRTIQRTTALAFALAAACPPSAESIILTNGANFKIFFRPKNPDQLTLELDEPRRMIEAITDRLSFANSAILARADSTAPYDLEVVIPDRKIVACVRALANLHGHPGVLLESHCDDAIKMIEPLDPALLPGKERKSHTTLWGPFLICAIGRNWKTKGIEMHLTNGVIVTLPVPHARGFGADDVRPAFDSRWALHGSIHENRERGIWELDGDAKLEPMPEIKDLFDGDNSEASPMS